MWIGSFHILRTAHAKFWDSEYRVAVKILRTQCGDEKRILFSYENWVSNWRASFIRCNFSSIGREISLYPPTLFVNQFVFFETWAWAGIVCGLEPFRTPEWRGGCQMMFFCRFFFPPTSIELRTSVSICSKCNFSSYSPILLVIEGFLVLVLELVLKQNPVGWLQRNHWITNHFFCVGKLV